MDSYDNRLSDQEMKELIEKYEKKEISYDQLKFKYQLHINSLIIYDPNKFWELQKQVLDQYIIEQLAFKCLIKEVFKKDG